MSEDFVSFEIAKKLKEKGFELRTRYGYIPPIKLIHEAFTDKDWTKINGYAAPTISQVLKWLREEKLILIGLSPMQEYGGDEVVEWCATVYKADKQGGLSWQEEFYYQSYEQAALAGIEYVLDNLI